MLKCNVKLKEDVNKSQSQKSFLASFCNSLYSKISISKLKLRYFTATKASRLSNGFHELIIPAEASVRRCSSYRCSEKFCIIHRETPVLESFFSKVAGFLQLY